MKVMANFLFIDDSGSKQWDIPYSRDFVDNPPARTPQNLDFWRKNYFVLAGLHIDTDTMALLNPIINQKKEQFFGTKHVELHSVNLRNQHKAKKEYLDKFNIPLDSLRSFVDDFWYPIFLQYELQLIAIIIDKRYYKNPRHEGKTPLEIAVEALFDRTELHPHSDCRIIFDQMDSQIRSTKRDQGKILRISSTKINLNDGKFEDKYHHVSVGFEKSANSNFLQLADMVAYNVWRQFVDYGNEWDNHSPNYDEHHKLPTYSYFERISRSFYCDNKNKVNGFGIVKLPDPNNKMRGWYIEPQE